MIFGYRIDFVEFPYLNHPSASQKHIVVRSCTIPDFAFKTAWLPHSKRLVRYCSHEPFAESKGFRVAWAMEVSGVVTLVWSPEKGEIHYAKGKEFSPERLRFWVYHTFLPLLFELEDIYHILHVGAVEVEKKALLFMAPSFGGKSTLTDHFLKSGYRLLSDDTLAIEKTADRYRAVAAWPFHRPYRQVETLGQETAQFVTQPLPIAGIFLLDKALPDAKIELEEIRGIEKFKALQLGSFIQISFLSARTFAFKSDLARYVSMYRVRVPWDKRRLCEVEERIISKIKEIPTMT